MEKTIRQWMQNELNFANPHDYFDNAGEPNYTKFAEQAILDLAGDDYESWFSDELHPVWELSIQILDNFAPQYRQMEEQDRYASSFQKEAETLPNTAFTDWMIDYIEYGLQLEGNIIIREFSEDIYAAAQQTQFAALPKKLEEMVVKHYVYGIKESCDLPSPFTNFILDGLRNRIDWDDVALVISKQAREQMRFN